MGLEPTPKIPPDVGMTGETHDHLRMKAEKETPGISFSHLKRTNNLTGTEYTLVLDPAPALRLVS